MGVTVPDCSKNGQNVEKLDHEIFEENQGKSKFLAGKADAEVKVKARGSSCVV